MPSVAHEAPLALFRECPELIPLLLRDVLHLEVPEYTSVRIEEADLSQVLPSELRADLIVSLTRAGGAPVLGTIVEVQLRPDPAKRRVWPEYITRQYARLGCLVELLVFTNDEAVARWASEPIRLGSRSLVGPVALGPGKVPWVRLAEEAVERPELAVLSALAHGNEPGGVEVALVAVSTMLGLDPERGAFYYDLIRAALNEAARRALEKEMQTRKHEYLSDFARRYFAEGEAKGRAEGRAEGVLMVLEARGIALDEAMRARILACRDRATLDRWLVRAATCPSAAEVFAED